MTKDDDGNPVLNRICLRHVSFWNYFRISNTPSGHVDRCKFRFEFYTNSTVVMGVKPISKMPSANCTEYI
jgi:hypothetical protein